MAIDGMNPGAIGASFRRLGKLAIITDARLGNAAEYLTSAVRQKLTQPGSGRLYPSARGDGTQHQASAPGEPPAPDTGELRRSAHKERVKAFHWRSQVDAHHPDDLEFGSRARHILPRPFMRPALASALPQMTRALQGQPLHVSEL